MSMSYAANKLRVPPGFEHLLEGLAREILREQPKNLLEFAARYFSNKLQERDGGNTQSILPPSGDQNAQTTTQDEPSPVVPSETPDTANVPPVTTNEPQAMDSSAPEDAPQVMDTGATTADRVGDTPQSVDDSAATTDAGDTPQAVDDSEKIDEQNVNEGEKSSGVKAISSETALGEDDGHVETGEGGGDTEKAQADDDVEPEQSVLESEVNPTPDAVAEEHVSQQDVSDVVSGGMEGKEERNMEVEGLGEGERRGEAGKQQEGEGMGEAGEKQEGEGEGMGEAGEQEGEGEGKGEAEDQQEGVGEGEGGKEAAVKNSTD